MDQSAIKTISELGKIPELIAQLAGSATPLALLPSSMDIASLEQYMENASHFRLKLETNNIDDYINYVKEHDEDGATCLINPYTMAAKTIFDLGVPKLPGHKHHTATLNLERTAAFKALLDTNGASLSQKEAGEFIEDWTDHIEANTSDGTVITNAAAVHALQKLSISQARELTSNVDDLSQSLSAFEQIEAKNKESIPTKLHFSCNPYHGISKHTLTIRISILTGGDKPKLKLRITQLEAHKENFADELKKKIKSNLANLKLNTYIGKVD